MDTTTACFVDGTTVGAAESFSAMTGRPPPHDVVRPPLPIIDESLFCQLLEGPGKVMVDIVVLEQYFLPFVSFCADAQMPAVRYGAIVRCKSDLLAARSVAELIGVLRDIAGGATSLEIHSPTYSSRATGPRHPWHAMSHWFR